MQVKKLGMAAGLSMAIAGLVSGCVIAPRDGYREGYYDHDHNRYYHEHEWHECRDRDDHCR